MIKSASRQKAEYKLSYYDGKLVQDFQPYQMSLFQQPEERKVDSTYPNDLAVILPYAVWCKLMIYTKCVDCEIGGLGLVERVGNKFYISEVYLLKQEVTQTETTLDLTDVSRLMQELHQQGKDVSKLRFWWHSHNTMATNWSGTDEETGRDFAGDDYLISIVTNHKGDMRCRMNFYKPISLTLDCVPIIIEKLLPEEGMIKGLQDEITEKVKRKWQAPIGYHGLGYSHDGYKDFDSGECYRKDETPVTENPNGKPKASTWKGTVAPMGEKVLDKGVRWAWDIEKGLYIPYNSLTDEPIDEYTLYTNYPEASDLNALCGIEYGYD